MLFPYLNRCTFEDNDKAQTKLRSLSREADRISADFGGWLSVPRKRKSKPRLESEGDKTEKKVVPSGDKLKCVIPKNDQYYKRYRTDPLEGTFKHFMNYGQYIKVYRETTTLCYKQKTLHELTSLYSATLDTGRFLRQKQKRAANKSDKRSRWDLLQDNTWPDDQDFLPQILSLPCIKGGEHEISNWQSYELEVQEKVKANRVLQIKPAIICARAPSVVVTRS